MKTNSEIRLLAKANIKKNWGMLLLTLVLFAVVEAAASVIPVVGNLLVVGPLTIGVMAIFAKAAKDEEFNMWMLFDRFDKSWGDTLLCVLLRDIFVGLGCALFIVPGIIFNYSFCMSTYLLYKEPELKGREALSRSRELMMGYKMRVFLMDLSFIGWGILTCLTFGVLAIWVAPYMTQAKYMLFEEIYAHKDDVPEVCEDGHCCCECCCEESEEKSETVLCE